MKKKLLKPVTKAQHGREKNKQNGTKWFRKTDTTHCQRFISITNTSTSKPNYDCTVNIAYTHTQCTNTHEPAQLCKRQPKYIELCAIAPGRVHKLLALLSLTELPCNEKPRGKKRLDYVFRNRTNDTDGFATGWWYNLGFPWQRIHSLMYIKTEYNKHFVFNNSTRNGSHFDYILCIVEIDLRARIYHMTDAHVYLKRKNTNEHAHYKH